MAAPVGKSELWHILVKAKLAARYIRTHHERLPQLQLQLQAAATTIQGGGGDGDAAQAMLRVKLVGRALINVYFFGLERGARHLHTCLTTAASNGVGPSLPPSFSAISDERLYDELVALRLPAAPATEAQALAHCEAALYTVKLCQEHPLPHCVELFVKITAAATGTPPQPQDAGRMEQARTYLNRACTLANLAVKHVDRGVAAISGFLDPQDVASINSFVERIAII